MLFAATDPQAEAVLINLLRQASPARKLAMVGELNNTVQTLALAGLRQRFPAAGSAAWPACCWALISRARSMAL